MDKMENTYRMTDRDIRLMIQLRAANADVFTGRKNSAMRGWRAIRKEMGIQGALTPQQLKKKWDNLKDKYRALKNPPVGMETQTNSWRWFHLMDEAMSGARPSLLSEDAAAIALLLPKTEGGSPGPGPGSRALGGVGTLSGIEAESRTGSPVQFSAIPDRVHVSPPARNESQTALLYAAHVPDEAPPPPSCSAREDGAACRRLEALQREWRALEAEQAEFDGELIALERDRELLSRDTAALERDRVLLERDREVLDRDRVVLDRDRAFLDRDRAFLDRDRVFLERAREDLERERALLRKEREGPAGRTTEKEVVLQTRFYQRLMDLDPDQLEGRQRLVDLDPDQLEGRQRLVGLFQRLVEKL
ncbi:uncharacterized protein LOC117731920 isoform X3 [Cyclopterus lumpus]|uniref:uncharacterized protein LOC117731920 isoform X3 n=1 Tax=Cyclopterus lumpus TaxID=8103 RepID=UPI0014868F93|nr:uncharacterized protein LOC117731920 isoform X3 [Cyclopterus lumpus]